MANVGKFISIEGIEGVGKSTVTQFLQEMLALANIPYTVTREGSG